MKCWNGLSGNTRRRPPRANCRAARCSASRWRGRSPSSRAVLLLDEPTANLDPYNVSLIEDILRAAQEPETPHDHRSRHTQYFSSKTAGETSWSSATSGKVRSTWAIRAPTATSLHPVCRAGERNQFVEFLQPGEPDHTSWSTPQDLTDPAVVQLTNDPNWAEMRDPKFKDEIKSAQLSVNRSLDWGWFNGLDVGVAYNQRDKDVKSDSFLLTLTDAADRGVPLQAIPAGALRDPVMIDVGGIDQRVLSWDVPSIMGLYTVTRRTRGWPRQINSRCMRRSRPVS